jgi:DegV family protein with EDD domain
MPTTPTIPSQRKSQAQMPVRIVTDSVAQVPPDMVVKLNVQVVPATLILDDHRYQDGIDLPPQLLYQRMRIEKLPIQTTSPSVGQFYEHFTACLAQGPAQILYVGISSRMSATFSAAAQAASLLHQENPELVLSLFDSRIATIAQGFLVMEAARMAIEGATIDEIIADLEILRKNVGLVAALDTLEYLARGGRIGKAAYMLGSLIHVKPIVTLGEEGLVAPLDRVHSLHDALVKMVEYVVEKSEGRHLLRLAIMEADAAQHARELKELALQQLQPDDCYWTDFTPVMVAHAGPGILGLAYQIK